MPELQTRRKMLTRNLGNRDQAPQRCRHRYTEVLGEAVRDTRRTFILRSLDIAQNHSLLPTHILLPYVPTYP